MTNRINELTLETNKLKEEISLLKLFEEENIKLKDHLRNYNLDENEKIRLEQKIRDFEQVFRDMS